MADLNTSRNSLQLKAEHTVRQAGPVIERFARAGYAAKGIVYIVIGILAVKAAFSSGGKTTNSQGALSTIAHEPFGQFLLALVGIGLAGYALWCIVQAAIDADNKGNDAKGILSRLGSLISGISYGVLAYTAYQILTGNSHPTGDNTASQDWTAKVLAMPFGQALVGIVGLVIVGLGIAQIVRGYKADFSKHLALSDIPAPQQKWAVLSGRWGYAAQGIVFAIVGGFLVNAAIHTDPHKAKGLGSALDLLAQQPFGPLLLGIVAAGLVAYGVFMLVEARYRRISV